MNELLIILICLHMFATLQPYMELNRVNKCWRCLKQTEILPRHGIVPITLVLLRRNGWNSQEPQKSHGKAKHCNDQRNLWPKWGWIQSCQNRGSGPTRIIKHDHSVVWHRHRHQDFSTKSKPQLGWYAMQPSWLMASLAGQDESDQIWSRFSMANSRLLFRFVLWFGPKSCGQLVCQKSWGSEFVPLQHKLPLVFNQRKVDVTPPKENHSMVAFSALVAGRRWSQPARRRWIRASNLAISKRLPMSLLSAFVCECRWYTTYYHFIFISFYIHSNAFTQNGCSKLINNDNHRVASL